MCLPLAQPEPREDVIPRGWLEAFHWETPRSLFKLLPSAANLPCQTPQTQVDDSRGKWQISTAVTFHFLATFWCICVCVHACITESSELITAVSVRLPLRVCVCLIFHLSVVIVTAVLSLITWSDSVKPQYQPTQCCERGRQVGREEERIYFHLLLL